jgi:tripartite-type tricarboxylate transporter receptor subunit TctC
MMVTQYLAICSIQKVILRSFVRVMRVNLKRTVVIFILLAMIIVIPLGCGNNASTPAATPAAAKTNAPAISASAASPSADVPTKQASTSAVTNSAAASTSAVAVSNLAAAAEFYKGKTVTIYTGAGVAGSAADLWARTLAKYLPEITSAKYVVQNETAGGGRVITNQMYNQIKPDGLSLLFQPLGETWTPYMTDDPAVKYEIAKFSYVGGTSSGNFILMVGPDSKIKTVDDLMKAKGLKFAHGAKTASTTFVNALAMEILHLDGKLITGFEGSQGRLLAVQQGDCDGTVMNPDNALLAENKGQGKTLMQVGTTRTKPGENLPTMMEFVKADSLTDNQKRLLATTDFLWDSKQLMTCPGVPQDRLDFMEDAFKKVLNNADFRAEISKTTNTEIGPYVSGAETNKRAIALVSKKGDIVLWNDMLTKYVK